MLQQGDALIVVDMQRDFLPGGALAVAEGDAIVPVMNRYVQLFSLKRLLIAYSRDWHPANHCSFQAQGGPWPPHCVANTSGAEFATGLDVAPNAIIVSKATESRRDAYSAFQDTDLAGQLQRLGVRRVYVGGLATDYCVRATVEAALDGGFEAFVLKDAIRAVNVHPGDGDAALQAMLARGACAARYEDLSQ